MKVISYNINDSTPWKIEKLLGMEADVWVVPEITCPEDAQLPEEYEMKWYGKEYVHAGKKKWKGLGVIWKKGRGVIADWFNPDLMYGIPLIFDDEYLILAFWPTKKYDGSEKKGYPKIAQEIIHEYAPHFNEYKTLVIGDYNCCVNQPDMTKKYGGMLRVNEMLESLGLFSLYHHTTGETFGQETLPTYYHRFNENDPFFLDYAYTNAPIWTFRLFPWDKEMSDHVGMEVKLQESFEDDLDYYDDYGGDFGDGE